MSELRWHPLRATWVITATHRQDRTFKPPRDWCPLCPTRPGVPPTELPFEDFQVAVFDNRFPSFHAHPPGPAVADTLLLPVLPARGRCEVVVYSADHEGNLGTLTDERRELLIHAWRDRTEALLAQRGVRYVMIFENRGDAIGVTLSHPHGQIYAYPFVPPEPAQALRQARRHLKKTGQNLHLDLLARERADRRRMVHLGRHFAVYVPFYAQFPYETVVVPRRHVPLITSLKGAEITELAVILGKLVRAFDSLFQEPMPYLMLLHQGPATPAAAAATQMRFVFLSALRAKGKLKYLAGCEQGAGTFINDTLPENTAPVLREAFARA